MKEQLITFETAKLAKEKGFKGDVTHFYELDTIENHQLLKLPIIPHDHQQEVFQAPTQSLLQKFIRKTRNVHIEVHRNASGYYWSMCIEDGGTDLGWSDMSGPNDSGVWNSFEDSLENALQVQLCYDLPEDKKLIEHWGNYVEFAINHFNTLKL